MEKASFTDISTKKEQGVFKTNKNHRLKKNFKLVRITMKNPDAPRIMKWTGRGRLCSVGTERPPADFGESEACAMRFEEMAQELVEATSRLIGRRDINMMDTNGVIISSTSKERIGTVHAGALEVIRTGRAVAIRKEQAGRYPGAREGYNLPVCSGGRLIAVIGILGDPDEVKEIANLLAVYTEKYIAQNALAMQEQALFELRTRYLHLLLALSPGDDEMLASLSEALCIRQEFPVRVFAIRLKNERNALNRQEKLNRMANNLLDCGRIRSTCDVWGTVDGSLVIVKSREARDGKNDVRQIAQCVRDGLSEPFQICIGSPCFGVRDIRRSYEEAKTLRADNLEISDITQPECRFRYLLRSTCARGNDYVEELCRQLRVAFNAGELDALMDSVACYYQENRSVSRAAARMNIHKNTMQYRLHKVWDTLGLNGCGAFAREYFLRLCLLRYERDV